MPTTPLQRPLAQVENAGNWILRSEAALTLNNEFTAYSHGIKSDSSKTRERFSCDQPFPALQSKTLCRDHSGRNLHPNSLLDVETQAPNSFTPTKHMQFFHL